MVTKYICLTEVYREKCMLQTCIFEWYKRFAVFERMVKMIHIMDALVNQECLLKKSIVRNNQLSIQMFAEMISTNKAT